MRKPPTGLPITSRGRTGSSSSIRSLVRSVSTSSFPNARRRMRNDPTDRVSPILEKILVILCFLIAGLLLPILFSGATLKTEVDEIIHEANVTIGFVEKEVEFVEEEMNLDPKIANASWQSTAKLLSAMMLGVMTSYAGILDAAAVQSLARLTYYVFMPALMLVSVNQALSSSNDNNSSEGATGLSSQSLMLMPIIGVLHVLMGYAIARILTYLQPSKRSATDDRDVWMNCAFGNATPLPLVIATSLFPHGHPLTSDMTACISFYTVVESPIFYTWGADFLLTPAERPPRTKSSVQTILQSFFSLPILAAVLGILVGKSDHMQDWIAPGNALAPLYASIETFATAYLPSTILVLAGSMSNDSNNGNESSAAAKPSASEEPKTKIKSPPSSQNGNVPTTKRRQGVRQQEFSAVDLGGGTADSSFDKKRAVPTSISPLTVALTCVARFILLPFATIAMIDLFMQPYLIMETPRNKALISLVVLMQGSMPPAQNSALLLTLAGCPERAARLTKTLTICYLVSIVPVTIWMSRHLQATQVLQFAQQSGSTAEGIAH